MRWLALVVLMATATVASASGTIDGKIRVIAKDGSQKVDGSGAVVFVADMSAPDRNARAEIRQRSKEFLPRVAAIPAGATISFPNDDAVEHNVFSHSAISEFDLGRYSRGRGKTVAFQQAGVAEIFCNVHKEMVTYVVVAPSPAFAVTGSNGTFKIQGIPPGRHKLTIWHRFARPRTQTVEVDVKEGEALMFRHDVLEQIEAEAPHKNKFGVEYPVGYH